MDTALAICITIIIMAIAVLLYSAHNDRKENTEDEKIELTNETKIRLQFEKAKSEINLLNKKAMFYNNLADLINLVIILIIGSILISALVFIAGLAGCASVYNALR